MEDTRNYIRFHLERAGAKERLFSDDAVKRLFQASQGTPRRVNQLALHALIQAAVMGHDAISGDFLQNQLQAHPLYDTASSAGFKIGCGTSCPGSGPSTGPSSPSTC